ncbi:MAG: hypothetical protein QNK37_13730 [Acidobacteriota bacterium]|nr:hypothetical protein [Acidobacteriota bacterium]
MTYVKCLPVLLFACLPILGDDALTIGNVEPGSIAAMGFQLDQPTRITIEGKGASFSGYTVRNCKGDRNAAPLLFYAWILDSDTRKVVWHTFYKRTRESVQNRGPFNIDEAVNLEAGHYEAYYAAAPDAGAAKCRRNCKRVSYRKRHKADLAVTISGHRLKVDNGRAEVDRLTQSAVVAMIRQGNDQAHWQGFCLREAATLDLYALGEAERDGQHDYAWIQDMENNRRVWSLGMDADEDAGGADKNRRVRRTIHLPKGRYKVFYVSDRAHSWRGWNDLPPDDPQFWGVTLWPADKQQARRVTTRPYRLAEPVLAMNRAGNDSTLTQAFRLTRDTDLRVRCMGEGTARKGMVDRGMILDAETRAEVWSMNYRETHHAGGDMRNRLADEIVRLPKGDYLAVYHTDKAHAHGDWKGGKPFDPEAWGLTLWTEKPAQRARFQLLDELPPSPKVLVEILEIADNDLRRRNFKLDRTAHLRVRALGEGVGGQMVDYGWITSLDDGRVYWRMDWKKTRHAGGADKNRLVDDVIILPPGKYRLHYKTDDSHSTSRWNDNPPDNSENYGISLMFETDAP